MTASSPRAVPPYQWQPTTAAIAQRAGIPESEVIRFDQNTSPFATEWTRPLSNGLAARLNDYPAADYRRLRTAAAAFHGVSPEWVAVGAGADELILLAAHGFLSPGRRSVMVTPTYPLYRIATAQQAAELIEVDLAPPAFEFPTERISAAAATADVTWLCVPNNPTGNRAGDAELARVLDAAAGIVVLDAAYAQFSGDRWEEEVRVRPNLVVLHTMSKAFGLAAIRVGYALAHPGVIATFDRLRPPGSISTASAEIATAAFGRAAEMQAAVDSLVRARDELAARLRALGLEVLPSRANFLLCALPSRSAGPSTVANRLMDEGLAIRTFAEPGPLDHHVRFTARTPADHDRLIDALERNL